MGLDEYEADRRLADGPYRRMTAQVHGNAVACTPAPAPMTTKLLSGWKPSRCGTTASTSAGELTRTAGGPENAPGSAANGVLVMPPTLVRPGSGRQRRITFCG
jgi:hypothetical protein